MKQIMLDNILKNLIENNGKTSDATIENFELIKNNSNSVRGNLALIKSNFDLIKDNSNQIKELKILILTLLEKE